MAIMQAAREARFTQETSKQLSQKYPEFVAGKGPEAIQVFVQEVLELCKKYRITTRQNIRRIVKILAEHQISLPLPESLLLNLKATSQTESRRTENLHLNIASGSYKLLPIVLNLP